MNNKETEMMNKCREYNDATQESVQSTPSDLTASPCETISNLPTPFALTASPRDLPLDEITGIIIDTSIKIHRTLGPGLLESVYEKTLEHALIKRGLLVESQKSVCFEYEGLEFKEGFRVDLLVENKVVVELKSVEKTMPVHYKQLLTYLRLMKMPVGLLINFGGATLKEGLHRIVNNLLPSELTASPRETISNLSTPSALTASPRETIFNRVTYDTK